jgi:predicted Zn finger-like uncharacterized protein
MSNQKADLTCEHCGQAFKVFLSEMAEHNQQVTCPSCGRANEGGSQAIVGPSRKQIAKSRTNKL